MIQFIFITKFVVLQNRVSLLSCLTNHKKSANVKKNRDATGVVSEKMRIDRVIIGSSFAGECLERKKEKKEVSSKPSPHLSEGTKGVKWELGFGRFFTGKIGLGTLVMGITNKNGKMTI